MGQHDILASVHAVSCMCLLGVPTLANSPPLYNLRFEVVDHERIYVKFVFSIHRNKSSRQK